MNDLKKKEAAAIAALKTFLPMRPAPNRLHWLPFATKKGMRRDFSEYPKYYYNYIRAFDKLVKLLNEKGANPRWKSGEEVMRWWVSDINEIWGQQLFEGFNLLDV